MPIGLVLSTFLLALACRLGISKSVLLSAAVLGLLVFPTLWIFLSSQTPESWRVSIPALLAFTGASVPFCLMLSTDRTSERAPKIAGLTAAVIIYLLIIFAEFPVTLAEAKLRVQENKFDRLVLDILQQQEKLTKQSIELRNLEKTTSTISQRMTVVEFDEIVSSIKRTSITETVKKDDEVSKKLFSIQI